MVEGGQSDLDGPQVVEAGVAAEVDVQPLGQRLQPPDALRAVVERRGSGDDQVQARVPPGVDLVDELPQRVEPLLPHVAADPLQGLDLVEHQHEPGIAGVAEDGQQSPEEVEGGEMVDIPLDSGGLLGPGGDVRLAASQAISPSVVAGLPSARARQ